MKIPGLGLCIDASRNGFGALRQLFPSMYHRVQRRLPGAFQPYNHTLPDRYPWLFQFAAAHLGVNRRVQLLSFGCSRGEEVFSLRRYFPLAEIKGIDIDPRNIACCETRARVEESAGLTFAAAATTKGEPTEFYDAIFCLAVLCLGDLTTSRAERCDPHLRFEDFERQVADFARCLRPGGLLFLHTTNFRFSDTIVARDFDVALESDPSEMAPDVLFDRDNILMKGAKYHAVGFLKHGTPRGSR
jgi:SAM-dependent methyltransferase